MDATAFWELIAVIDADALRDGDEDAALAPLTTALTALPEAEVAGFAEQLAQALFALDGRAYADGAGESGDSDDAFLYARCFVVASGRGHFERVLRDPTAMPDSLDDWCEGLLYVPQRAWAVATGNDEEAWPHRTSVSYETGSNRAGWPPA